MHELYRSVNFESKLSSCEFFQRTNIWICFHYYATCFRLFFGRNWGLQRRHFKTIWPLDYPAAPQTSPNLKFSFRKKRSLQDLYKRTLIGCLEMTLTLSYFEYNTKFVPLFKVRILWEDQKILWNLPLNFVSLKQM